MEQVRKASEAVIWLARVVNVQVLLLESKSQFCGTFNNIGYCTESQGKREYSPCFPPEDKRDADCGKIEKINKQKQ